jgi:hypothetical protein
MRSIWLPRHPKRQSKYQIRPIAESEDDRRDKGEDARAVCHVGRLRYTQRLLKHSNRQLQQLLLMLLSSRICRLAAFPGDPSGEDELIPQNVVYEGPVVLGLAIPGTPVLDPPFRVGLYPVELGVKSQLGLTTRS